MSPTPIRVLITDDHAMFRKGLRALLTTEPDIEVVGEAANGQEAIDLVAKLSPDIVLLDLVMPTLDGIEAMRQISQRHPTIRVLVLTSFSGDDKVIPAIRAGAAGYLLKDSDPEELVRAIHLVHQGESSLHPSVARALLREVAHPTTSQPANEVLTEREIAVLRLIARGFSNKDIAAQLPLNEKSVRTYVSRILDKLHLTSRTQAALYALREGLASLDEKG